MVLSTRPTVLEAAAVLSVGATAYISLDAPPGCTAEALARASRGGVHLEPELAAALLALLQFHGALDSPLRAALQLARRGWAWPVASHEASLDPGAADRRIRELWTRMRQAKY